MSAVPFESERNALDRLIDDLAGRPARREARRMWAAVVLARHVDTCASICRGDRVRVGNLDRFVLRRGLRGDELPDPESYLLVTPEMLDAIDEAGVIVRKTVKR